MRAMKIVGIFGGIALVWLILVAVLHVNHTSLTAGDDFAFTRKGTRCDISKVVHQTWKTGKVHSRFREHIQSWILHNPEWEYKFWTNEDNRNLIVTKYPQYLEMYDNYPQNIQRADAIR
jgi:mannosyltransferase OCH1-like enzyme